MTTRTTRKFLRAIVDRINRATGSPMEPYEYRDGQYRANVGNYHLDRALGGYMLCRMANDAGGVTAPMGSYRLPPAMMAHVLGAYAQGIETSAAVATGLRDVLNVMDAHNWRGNSDEAARIMAARVALNLFDNR